MPKNKVLQPTAEQWASVGPIEGKSPLDAAAHRMIVLRNAWTRTDNTWQAWQDQLKEVIEYRVWEFYPVDKPYGTLEALLQANGINPKLALSEEAFPRRLNGHGGDRRSNGFQVDDHQLEKTKGGTSKGYIEARLERDYPDILKRWHAGEFKSARQAGIAAGFVKKDGRYFIPDTPDEAGIFLAERVDDEWMCAMVKAYEDACDAKIAKEFHEAVERGEMETVPWDEVEAGLREKGLL